MKLVTKELLRRLPVLYSTQHDPDPMVQTKFFTPDSNYTWFVLEGETEECSGDMLFWGLVKGQFQEVGYFRLSELENIRGPLGLKVERDRHFVSCPLSSVERGE